MEKNFSVVTLNWCKIDDYNYQVSSCGEVRSIDRIVMVCDSKGRTYKRLHRGKILSQKNTKTGYKIVNLWKNGKGVCFYVHRLVARYFIGNSNLTVNHKDLDKSNNNVENLEYMTHVENMKHAHANKRGNYRK